MQAKGFRIRGRKGQALRSRRLAVEPLCRLCREEGRITPSTVPDHILPLAKGGLDVERNIRCLCGDCHDKVTREQFGQKQRLTYGEDGWPAQ